MCLSPRIIPNSSYRPQSLRSLVRSDSERPVSYINSRYISNITSRTIEIPCGHCAECRRKAQNQMVQRALVQSLNYHCIMITLTYRDGFLPFFDLPYRDDEGYEHSQRFYFPDIRDVQNMFKRIRKYDEFHGRAFKYVLSSEYGGKKHRPHFHILLYLSRNDDELINGFVDPNCTFAIENLVASAIMKHWVRNVGSHKKPDYQPLCEYVRRGKKSTFQCEFVRDRPNLFGKQRTKSGISDVSYYVTKYCLKFDEYQNFLHEKLTSIYYRSTGDDLRLYHGSAKSLPGVLRDGRFTFGFYWNLLRPKVIASKYFGLSDDLQHDYILDCIGSSISRGDSFAKFKNPVTGKFFGLSAYYLRRCMDALDYLAFYENKNTELKDNDYDTFSYKDYSAYSSFQSELQHNVNAIDNYRSICERIRNRNTDNFVSSDMVNDFDGTVTALASVDVPDPFAGFDFDSDPTVFEHPRTSSDELKEFLEYFLDFPE